jgi:glycosyltransferase involved in cell wall biosynthesis
LVSKLRLLAISHTYPRYQGDTNGPFVKFLMDELATSGIEVDVLTAWDEEFDSAYVASSPARLHLYKYAPFKSWHILGYSRTIKSDVKVKAVMLLLAPLMIVSGIYQLLKLARKLKPDIIQAHWFLPNGFIASIVSRLTGIPVIATLHGSDVFVAEKGFPYSFMTAYTNRTIKRLSSCSPELRDRICALGLHRSRSHVVPYAADPEMINLRTVVAEVDELRNTLLPVASFPVLFVLGRLVYKKGFEYLIRAIPKIIEKCPQAKLIIAGEGDLDQELKSLTKELGIEDSVIFVGRLLRDKIPLYMSICDIFIMPSIKDQAGNIDGLPNVILEAMAMSKPVIATNVAGIPIAVRDGVNGKLIMQKCPDSLADAVIESAKDKARLQTWGKQSRKIIEEELNWPVIAARYRDIFSLIRVD